MLKSLAPRSIVLLLLLVCLKSSGLKASCCSGASAFGMGRLLRHERALVELYSKASMLYGSFDERAQLRFGDLGTRPYLVFDQEIQIMARLFEHFEPFLRLPSRVQKSSVRTGASLADMSLGFRSPILKENFIKGAPAISFFHALKIPSGVSFEHDHESHIEKITSQGEWLLSFGIGLEKELGGLDYGLNYSFSCEPDHFLPSVALKPSFIHSPSLSVGLPLDEHGSLAFSLATTFHSALKKNGLALLESDRRKVSLSASYSYSLHSHLKINAQVGADVPIPYAGKNFDSEFFLRLGMRLGVF